MFLQALSDLGKEFKKFTTFILPEPVKAPSSEAYSLLIRDDIELPISSKSSPIPKAFDAVLTYPKTMQMSNALVSSMCNVINSEFIQGDALLSVLRSIEKHYQQIEIENCLKVLKFSTTLANTHLLDFMLLKELMNIILTLSTYQNNTVSGNSLAAFSLILNYLVEYPSDSITDIAKKEIDELYKNHTGKPFESVHVLDQILEITLHDVFHNSFGGRTIWLKQVKLDKKNAYSLLSEFLCKFPRDTLSGVASDVLRFGSSNEIYVTDAANMFDRYMKILPDDSTFLLSESIQRLSNRDLAFIRTIFSKTGNPIVKYFECGGSCPATLIQLIMSLRILVQQTSPKEPVYLTISEKFDSSDLQCTVPPEIAAILIQSCFEDENESSKTLFNEVWSDIITIISISINYVTSDGCYVLLSALHSTIVMSKDFDLDDSRGAAISSFVTILATVTNPDIKQTAVNTLTAAIEDTPGAFSGHWSKLVAVLAELMWEPTSLEFSKKLDESSMRELSSALAAVRQHHIDVAADWSLGFLVALMDINADRFMIVWENVRGIFDGNDLGAIESFRDIFNNTMSKDNELALCEAHSKMVHSDKVPSETKLQLINDLQEALARYQFGAAFPAVFSSIFPDDAELIDAQFRTLEIIGNDILYSLDHDNQTGFLKLIYEFATQHHDINISLSAVGMLWGATSIAKDSDRWCNILQLTAQIISDDRNEVSFCAVRTLFSLLTSNSVGMDDKVFGFLSKTCFKTLIENLIKTESNNFDTIQLALYELAHCGCVFRERFDSEGGFGRWDSLIEAQERFMLRCTKRNSKCNGFLFYEDAYGIEEERINILDSLMRIAIDVLSKDGPNSSVYGSFGRLFRMIIPKYHQSIKIEEVKKWIEISEKLIFSLLNPSYLPPTAHKSFDAFDELFPNDNEITETVFQHFIKCALVKENDRLVEVAIDHIADIFTQRVRIEQLPHMFIYLRPVLGIKYSDKIVEGFLERDPEIPDDLVVDVFALLSSISLNEATDEKAHYSACKLLHRVSADAMHEYVCKQTKADALECIWRAVLDPTSEFFDQACANAITDEVVMKYGALISSGEAGLQHCLEFLRTARTAYPGKPRSFHLMQILPVLADMVIHPDEEVRKEVRAVLLVIASECKP